jgi:uncharacterized protein YbjQ (UPF0145 family)
MLDLVVFSALLASGYIFGRVAEKRHFDSLRRREDELADILAFSVRTAPPYASPPRTRLVGGNAVMSVDYFKRVSGALRSVLGGRVLAFETLVERARREAILRMKEDAQIYGADMIVNVKLETSSITKGNSNQTACVEVYAYGTALIGGHRR